MLVAFALVTLAGAPAQCFETRVAVGAGEALTQQSVEPVACSPRDRPALRYDRASGSVVAVAPLAAGTYLGPLVSLPVRQVQRGARLTLRSAAGPVVVERPVTALQPGRSGRRIFVQDDAGNVMSAPVLLDGEGERRQ